MVSADGLHAVLLEREEETVVGFKHSSSQTEEGDEDLSFEESGGMTPGMEEESDDVTIQFEEEGGGGDEMFMGSEFDDLGEGEDEIGTPGGPTQTWNFQAELDDLLTRCAEQGYEDPEIAFCGTTSDVDRVELRLPVEESGEEDEEGEHGLPLPVARATLLEMLEEQYEGGVEDGRVGFVPMHRTGDGRQRVLALIARPGGTVLSTLSSMQDQTLARSPRAQVLDTEVSLYLGLARSILQLPPGTPEKTILVRTGPEDTLVLFIEGNTLRQLEYLPELTAEDASETICSRVLLLQDEYGMGEVQHLMLIAEDAEEVLADAFKSYFAGANLRLVRTHLPNGEKAESAGYVAAKGAALRLLDDSSYAPFFQPVNLLAKRYTASSFRLPVGWSVPVLLGLLAVTTLGFVWYYFTNASAISERRAELRRLEQQVEQVDQQSLQRRIDSLQSAAARYAEANEAVETLLKGSNKWSSGLATIAERMNSVDGLSLEQWSPEGDAEVVVAGRAADRSKVVQLARQVEGEILGITYSETRDVSLYDFQLTVPLDTTEPEAIEYWREQRGERLASVDEVTQSQAAESDTSSSNPSREGTSQPSSVQTESTTSRGSETAASSGETGWAVIVASLAQNADAETVAQRYRDRLATSDYSVQVRHSPENGRYRVTVGDFSSFGDARSVLREMNGALPEDAWVLEISKMNETDTTAEASSPDGTDRSSSYGPSEWTVVVSSHDTDSLAQKAARSYRARLSDEPHSVQVRQSPGNGRYRVGIGAFSSLDAAQAARSEMDSVVSADARIHRYSTTGLTSGEP
jgi:cell division protein FtsN/Tfp pilus assembly protein PilN